MVRTHEEPVTTRPTPSAIHAIAVAVDAVADPVSRTGRARDTYLWTERRR